MDYRELNKCTTKDSYLLPLPDEDFLDPPYFQLLIYTVGIGSCLFIWQLPVYIADREKTAFCPGPGMGLYKFYRMPFGLTGASSSFQRLMDTTLHRLPFVTIYLDDV